MSPTLIWNNLVTYSLQIGLLVGLAAFVPTALRLRLPGAKLVYWHILLVACLLLPVLGPWRQEVIAANVDITTTVVAMAPEQASHRSFSSSEIALLLLAAGVLARAVWLGVGFWRLRQYLRHSQPLPPALLRSTQATLRLCGEIASPVTFGFRKPVVLLPAQFPELEPAVQEAILCHELLHVERRDWIFTVAEELVRTALWFHPAIWWLLGEIQLAREQAVDREVVARTNSRDEYVDALLAIAGAKPQLDLAPAPLFLRKRHLKQRVVSILKEVRMSKTRLISALAAGLGILVAACWFVTGTLPLSATPQVVADAPGVAVETGGAQLMHRTPVVYPAEALARKIQGTVVVQAKLDANGVVTDATVLSGPDELRKAALQSVLNWHFSKDAGSGTRQISIAFQLPKGTQASPAPVSGALAKQVNQETPNQGPARTLKSIRISGLSDQAKADLLAQLPVHEGDAVTPEARAKVMQVVQAFDEHFGVTAMPVSATETALVIAPVKVLTDAAPAPVHSDSGDVKQIRIGGTIQQTKLISQPRPVYPLEAKQAGLEGAVKLQATIGTDGHVKNLEVLSGDAVLVTSAIEAVKQWVYEPTLLNGNPVEVITQIDVNYTLAK
jgi:TonB family protein